MSYTVYNDHNVVKSIFGDRIRQIHEPSHAVTFPDACPLFFPSTIRDADVILVLDGGRLVESGSHAELIARDGAYAKLCNR